jgi:cupin domain
MKSRILVLFAVVVGAFVIGGGVVQAEPPNGFSATVIATGTIARATEIGANGIEFQSRANASVITQFGDFVGGGTSGWHTHPGLTVVTVISGSVTNHTGCRAPVTYTAGQSFVEPPKTPIAVVDASATAAARVIATLVVPAGMAARTNVNAPTCPVHTDD